MESTEVDELIIRLSEKLGIKQPSQHDQLILLAREIDAFARQVGRAQRGLSVNRDGRTTSGADAASCLLKWHDEINRWRLALKVSSSWRPLGVFIGSSRLLTEWCDQTSHQHRSGGGALKATERTPTGAVATRTSALPEPRPTNSNTYYDNPLVDR